MSEERKTILLVDDDVDFVEANKVFLEQADFAVLTAHNSKECMEVLKNNQPDGMVIDVMMDYKSEGFDLARDLRHSEDYQNVPLLMLTSVNDEFPYNFEPHETWLPVDEFLEKPVEPENLVEHIKKQIEKAQ